MDNKRNYFDVFNHVINVECLPAIKALKKICDKEKKIIKNSKKNPFGKRNYGDLLILKRALVCLLCVRVTNIFKDNNGISYSDLNISLVKFKQDKIIKKMMETRQQWFGHIGKNRSNIVSGEEIIESNLEKIFKELYKLLESNYFNFSIK